MSIGLMSPDELAAELDGGIRSKRLRRNRTQQILAVSTGVSQWTVKRMETGDLVTSGLFGSSMLITARNFQAASTASRGYSGTTPDPSHVVVDDGEHRPPKSGCRPGLSGGRGHTTTSGVLSQRD